jgi:hypothetical protein
LKKEYLLETLELNFMLFYFQRKLFIVDHINIGSFQLRQQNNIEKKKFRKREKREKNEKKENNEREKEDIKKKNSMLSFCKLVFTSR